jgi:protein phosphatase
MTQIVVPGNALVILLGPAGSGKSTFARRWFAETEVVASDRCRAMIADSESDISVSARAFDLFNQILRHRLEVGRLAVADSTALTTLARRDLRLTARRAGAPAVVIALDVSLETCVRRDAGRPRTVGEEVVARHQALLREALRALPREGYQAWHRLDESTLETAVVRVEGRKPPTRVTSEIQAVYAREPWRRGSRR